MSQFSFGLKEDKLPDDVVIRGLLETSFHFHVSVIPSGG